MKFAYELDNCIQFKYFRFLWEFKSPASIYLIWIFRFQIYPLHYDWMTVANNILAKLFKIICHIKQYITCLHSHFIPQNHDRWPYNMFAYQLAIYWLGSILKYLLALLSSGNLIILWDENPCCLIAFCEVRQKYIQFACFIFYFKIIALW